MYIVLLFSYTIKWPYFCVMIMSEFMFATLKQCQFICRDSQVSFGGLNKRLHMRDIDYLLLNLLYKTEVSYFG